MGFGMDSVYALYVVAKVLVGAMVPFMVGHMATFHGSYVQSEEIEFVFENTQNVVHYFLEISFAFGNQFATFFNIGTYLR